METDFSRWACGLLATSRRSRPIDPNSATLHRLSSIARKRVSFKTVLWHTCSFADFSYSRPPRIIASSFFSLSLFFFLSFFSTSFHPPPSPLLTLAPGLVSRQFLSLPSPFSRRSILTRIFEEWPKLSSLPPLPPWDRILGFKSSESRLKTSHPLTSL